MVIQVDSGFSLGGDRNARPGDRLVVGTDITPALAARMVAIRWAHVVEEPAERSPEPQKPPTIIEHRDPEPVHRDPAFTPQMNRPPRRRK